MIVASDGHDFGKQTGRIFFSLFAGSKTLHQEASR
jgi:hypothetical protein